MRQVLIDKSNIHSSSVTIPHISWLQSPLTVLSTDAAQKEKKRFGVRGFPWYITCANLDKSFKLSDPQTPQLMKETNKCQVRHGDNRKVPPKNLKKSENEMVF